MPKDKFDVENIFTEELIHRLKEAENKAKEYEKEIDKLKKSNQKQSNRNKQLKKVVLTENYVHPFIINILTN